MKNKHRIFILDTEDEDNLVELENLLDSGWKIINSNSVSISSNSFRKGEIVYILINYI